ncbi:MAG: 2-hydroxychromene-2-carboxylate isomerase [Arenibacterium sp.]
MTEVDFYYDFGSPNAYLVHKTLPALAARHGAKVTYKPMLLGGVFKATQNQSPMQAFAGVAGKLDYQRREMARFVTRNDVPFAMNPHFPIMTIGVMRGAIYAEGQPWQAQYVDTVFNAMWRDGEKMDDPDTIARVLSTAGLPAADIMEATQTPEVKTALIEATDAAVKRGVFGAPTQFLGDEMFFGKDSLGDMEWVLSKVA